MRKTPRHRQTSPELSGKRVLRLSQETLRALGSVELQLVAGGSCPTGSWPDGTDTSTC